jgi:hypothetical protein
MDINKKSATSGLFNLAIAALVCLTVLVAAGKVNLPFVKADVPSIGPQATATTLPVTVTTLPQGAQSQGSQEILCPGTLESKLNLGVFDELTDDAFDLAPADYKVFDGVTGDYLSLSGNVTATSRTTVNVPCGANVVVKYTPNNDGSVNIYPVTEHLFAQGPSVNSKASGKVEGSVGVILWTTTGTESSNNITMSTGQTYTSAKIKIQELDNAKSAQNLVVLNDYNVSQIQSVNIVGTTKLQGVPVCFNTFKTAYDTGASLDNYGTASYDVVIKAMPGVLPACTPITVKVVDKSGYYQNVDKKTWVEPVAGTTIGMCDDNNNDVGIPTGSEGEATMWVNC